MLSTPLESFYMDQAQVSQFTSCILIGRRDVKEGLEHVFSLFRFRFKKDPNRGSYTDLVYIKPYCRIAPYLVGIALGYLIHIEKSEPGKSPLVSTCRQLTSKRLD